ncbi:hypothetical protein NR798_01445 [Archangium gephyra]|uniref:hypothetical protein n=1 Tax=Archangium gephyra TaxID=48 RepID=UPI0035D41479
MINDDVAMVDVGQPLKPQKAKALIKAIRESGGVALSDHALAELAKDQLESSDALNVLRAGIVREPEWENGEWRYRVETPRMTIVIAFDSETELAIVTGWRNRP